MYRQGIKANPDSFILHNDLGNRLKLRMPAEAEPALRRAIQINGRNPVPHMNLADALKFQGRYAERLVEYRRAQSLSGSGAASGGLLSQLIRLCEHQATLDRKLSAVFDGAAEPANAAEMVALASFCASSRKLYVTAIDLYQAAFAADPTLFEQLHSHRYLAACCAATRRLRPGRRRSRTR